MKLELGNGTLNGIGTTYYGEFDKRPDGSFVTIKWFVILFLPIWPIECVRVKKVFAENKFFPGLYMSQNTSYSILEKISKRKFRNLIIITLSLVYGSILALFLILYCALLNI